MERRTLDPVLDRPEAPDAAVCDTVTWVIDPQEAPEACRDVAYSVRRQYIDSFFERHLPELTGCVLDLGGTKTAKRGRFDLSRAQATVRYMNLDPATRPDCCCDAARLAVRDACCDRVVCAEVLEHVADPQALLHEIHRVLRPGGRLYLTAPLLYRVHAHPADYARYTDEGLKRLLAGAGFTVLAVYRQGLLFSVLADVLKQMVNHGVLGRGRLTHQLWRRLAAGFQRLAFRWERSPRLASQPFIQSFATGFAVVAEKR